VAQVVECLPINCEALSSNPSTAKKKKKMAFDNWNSYLIVDSIFRPFLDITTKRNSESLLPRSCFSKYT
jgi:hypothetical protein